jgi:hypothetical protein
MQFIYNKKYLVFQYICMHIYIIKNYNQRLINYYNNNINKKEMKDY